MTERGARRRAGSSVRRRAWVVLAAVAAAAIGVTAAPSGAVTGPFKVLDGPEDQAYPFVNDTYLIWTQNSEAHPSQDHAYGKVLGAAGSFRLDPAGSRGSAGGIDPGQNRAIYQQIDGRDSDLYFFNLDTRKRSRLPSPINTAKWEWGPRISDAFIFFARDAQGRTALFLYDRLAQTLQKVGSWDFTKYYVVPGAVDDRYATWTVCGPLSCNAFVRDTLTDITTKIQPPAGKSQYAPVVDVAIDDVYFVRSGQACGASVAIWRRSLTDLSAGGERVVLLPPGIDIGWTMSLDVEATRVDLWFSRYRCASRQGDIYELRDIENVP